MTQESLFNQANVFLDMGKTTKAFALFLAAAEQGDVHAYNSIGFCFDTGKGVGQDKKKALFWYKKALKAGEFCAYSNIGTVYRDWGNVKLARLWFLKALSKDDGDAALELAKLYLKNPTSRNVLQAKKYLHIVINYNPKYVTEASVEEAKILLKE